MNRQTDHEVLCVGHAGNRCSGERRAFQWPARVLTVAALVVAGNASVGCTSEDPPAPEPVTEVEGRQSTLGRAVDVAERTRDEADRYNEELEKAADPSDW